MSHKKLRKDLQTKLGLSPQALSNRIGRLQNKTPMTTEQAICVLAHQNNIKISNYVTAQELSDIRNLLPTNSNSYREQKKTNSRVTENKELLISIGKNLKVNAPLLTEKKIQEAKKMAEIYPLIYVLENSIRELIDIIMTKLHGNDWWVNQANSKLRKSVTDRMADDEKNAWHQKRGARPIDYLDLKDLPNLMRKVENNVVPNIFPTFQWFDQLVEEVYESRCVVCHMNPLADLNVKNIKVKFEQWRKQLKDKKSIIDSLGT